MHASAVYDAIVLSVWPSVTVVILSERMELDSGCGLDNAINKITKLKPATKHKPDELRLYSKDQRLLKIIRFLTVISSVGIPTRGVATGWTGVDTSTPLSSRGCF